MGKTQETKCGEKKAWSKTSFPACKCKFVELLVKLCAGAGCHEAPPVPPASSRLVVEEEVVDSEVEGLPVYKDTVEYKCAAGGHNLRLDWRAGQEDPSSFHVKCEEKGGDRVWEEVTWPTCAPSNHPPPGLHPQT